MQSPCACKKIMETGQFQVYRWNEAAHTTLLKHVAACSSLQQLAATERRNVQHKQWLMRAIFATKTNPTLPILAQLKPEFFLQNNLNISLATRIQCLL